MDATAAAGPIAVAVDPTAAAAGPIVADVLRLARVSNAAQAVPVAHPGMIVVVTAAIPALRDARN